MKNNNGFPPQTPPARALAHLLAPLHPVAGPLPFPEPGCCSVRPGIDWLLLLSLLFLCGGSLRLIMQAPIIAKLREPWEDPKERRRLAELIGASKIVYHAHRAPSIDFPTKTCDLQKPAIPIPFLTNRSVADYSSGSY